MTSDERGTWKSFHKNKSIYAFTSGFSKNAVFVREWAIYGWLFHTFHYINDDVPRKKTKNTS